MPSYLERARDRVVWKYCDEADCLPWRSIGSMDTRLEDFHGKDRDKKQQLGRAFTLFRLSKGLGLTCSLG